MPIIDIRRSGVTPHVRKTPTSTAAAILPMTPDRVRKEVAESDEQPIKVENSEEAFQKFKPKVNFKGRAGEEGAEFVADLEFNNLKDFEPDNILKHQGVKNKAGEMEYRRNDLADLKNSIDRLYSLRKVFDENSVRRAWNNEAQRGELIRLIGELQAEVKKLTPGSGEKSSGEKA